MKGVVYVIAANERAAWERYAISQWLRSLELAHDTAAARGHKVYKFEAGPPVVTEVPRERPVDG